MKTLSDMTANERMKLVVDTYYAHLTDECARINAERRTAHFAVDIDRCDAGLPAFNHNLVR